MLERPISELEVARSTSKVILLVILCQWGLRQLQCNALAHLLVDVQCTVLKSLSCKGI